MSCPEHIALGMQRSPVYLNRIIASAPTKTPNANILRLRDAIRPDEVNTPVRRVCYIAQLVLSGDVSEEDAQFQLLRGIEQLRNRKSVV